MKSAFLDKLLERLDRLDPESLQNQFIGLIQERGLLETIFQSIKEGVIVVDGDGKMTYANRAAEELLGFTISESRGRPVSSERFGMVKAYQPRDRDYVSSESNRERIRGSVGSGRGWW